MVLTKYYIQIIVIKTFTIGMKAWSAIWMKEGQHHSYAKSNKILSAIESFSKSLLIPTIG